MRRSECLYSCLSDHIDAIVIVAGGVLSYAMLIYVMYEESCYVSVTACPMP